VASDKKDKDSRTFLTAFGQPKLKLAANEII
jgi:hypothetical protein